MHQWKYEEDEGEEEAEEKRKIERERRRDQPPSIIFYIRRCPVETIMPTPPYRCQVIRRAPCRFCHSYHHAYAADLGSREGGGVVPLLPDGG